MSLSFDLFSKVLMWPLGMGPGVSHVDVGPDEVVARMGWGFHAVVPRSSIRAVERRQGFVLSRGVHGWRGRWLVNGSTRGLVTITIDPAVRARVVGFPVRLRELIVSMEQPDALVEALTVG